MKRILITCINGRFDELLIEYFISQQYNVRILAEFVDPGCNWLKWPVEIYSCSPHDTKELAYAVRGCDFIIATHFIQKKGFCKISANPSPIFQLVQNRDFSRLKAVVYLNEGIGARATGSNNLAGNPSECIKKAKYRVNHQNTCLRKSHHSNSIGVRIIYVDAARAISDFGNNLAGNKSFDILAGKIHDIMMRGEPNEKCLINTKSDQAQISWKLAARNWIETGLEYMAHIFRLPHNLTGL
jgi:hypothetical protein